jgi:hypothetical protein
MAPPDPDLFPPKTKNPIFSASKRMPKIKPVMDQCKNSILMKKLF